MEPRKKVIRTYDQEKTQKLKQILSACFNSNIFYSNILGNKETLVIKSLISTGADPNAVANGSCYHEYTLLEAIVSLENNYGYHHTLFLFLLENGADLNRMRGLCNDSPLMDACHSGCFGASVRLIAYGADVNYKNIWNRTPLLNAVMQSFMHAKHYLVQFLLENGAAPSIEISSCDFLGHGMQSPLSYARKPNYAEHYPEARKKIRELLESYRKQKLH